MKKYFFILFFLLPIHIFASPILSSKWEMLQEANKHKNKAKSVLLEAEEMCILIPDLAKRQHMRDLIAAIVMSSYIPGPKAKIITVGLTVVASLSTDMYDNYCTWRTLLAKAAYHLEMVNFYNSSSLYCSDEDSLKKMDNGTRAFLKAIDNLTMSEMLAFCLEDEEEQTLLSEQIVNQRSILIKKFNNPKAKIPENMYESAYRFSENIHEILAEFSDEELTEQIQLYVVAMAEDIELACRYWYSDLRDQNKR